MAGATPMQKSRLRKLGYSESEINGMSHEAADKKVNANVKSGDGTPTSTQRRIPSAGDSKGFVAPDDVEPAKKGSVPSAGDASKFQAKDDSSSKSKVPSAGNAKGFISPDDAPEKERSRVPSAGDASPSGAKSRIPSAGNAEGFSATEEALSQGTKPEGRSRIPDTYKGDDSKSTSRVPSAGDSKGFIAPDDKARSRIPSAKTGPTSEEPDAGIKNGPWGDAEGKSKIPSAGGASIKASAGVAKDGPWGNTPSAGGKAATEAALGEPVSGSASKAQAAALEGASLFQKIATSPVASALGHVGLAVVSDLIAQHVDETLRGSQQDKPGVKPTLRDDGTQVIAPLSDVPAEKDPSRNADAARREVAKYDAKKDAADNKVGPSLGDVLASARDVAQDPKGSVAALYGRTPQGDAPQSPQVAPTEAPSTGPATPVASNPAPAPAAPQQAQAAPQGFVPTPGQKPTPPQQDLPPHQSGQMPDQVPTRQAPPQSQDPRADPNAKLQQMLTLMKENNVQAFNWGDKFFKRDDNQPSGFAMSQPQQQPTQHAQAPQQQAPRPAPQAAPPQQAQAQPNPRQAPTTQAFFSHQDLG